MGNIKGVLLVNLGSPKEPTFSSVYSYLTEFLRDRRVIDLPRWQRELLVRGLIIPLRLRNSTRSYKAIWTDAGSPLVATTRKVGEKLQAKLGDSFQVEVAMRYQTPSIEDALKRLEGVSSLQIIPLFPQYASATVGSIFEKVTTLLGKQQTVPRFEFLASFHNKEGFYDLIAHRAAPFNLESYDKILFSYHGLPERQLKKASSNCLKGSCCETNASCYRAQCIETSFGIAKKLQIRDSKWMTTFQSRLGKEPWLAPYTLDTVTALAKEGAKKILLFSPAFTADCLETIYEIGVELKHDFLLHGGEKLDWVPSLNEGDDWVDFLASLSDQRGQPLSIKPVIEKTLRAKSCKNIDPI